MKAGFFQRYLLASFVFKSALIGGGYATGRELVEFFLSKGPVTGLAGIAVAAAIFSAMLAIAFEVARRYRLYDYRSLCRKLMGPGWIVYEAAFLALLVLVLSVLGAAAGAIGAERFGAPTIVGASVLMLIIATVVFFGTKAVERFFAGWSVVLYGAFAVFFVWTWKAMGHDVTAHVADSRLGPAALSSGVIYAGYCLAVIPTIAWCARHFGRPREAVVSGLLAGPIAMVPAVLFFLALTARYPRVNSQSVPIVYMLSELHAPVFHLVFQGVIFGTLVEAGSALIHGFNERVADVLAEGGRDMPRWARAAIALMLLTASIYLATRVGIVNLVAKGYGYSTWVFLVLIGAPLLTRGLWLVTRKEVKAGF